MAREINEQILSFGEIQEPHESFTIAYGSVRVEQNRLYKDVLPTDAVKQVIIMLQEQAQEMGADGVKNITVTVTSATDEKGEAVMDYYGMGTLIKLK
jgi:uncharacterized protein YbjQ (UPF0145 family)